MLFKTIKYAIKASVLSAALSGGVFAAAYYSTLDELPDVEELKNVSFETPMKIYTADDKLIGEFGEHKRIPVRLDEIPLKMRQAFLAIEDSRFYEHTGVDPVGILRAVVVAATSGGASQGASTITQQVARNFFLSRDKTLERKLKEIFIAWRIEQVLSKDEILELYLNKIALGHRSYGVVAAAQTYYGKQLKDLSLAEIATIAGLPKAPSTLNPITSPERAQKRRHLVLQRMRTLGYITDAEFSEADSAPSKTYFHSTPLEAYAPYVAEEARQYVIDKYGEEAYIRGIRVYTTVNSDYQNKAHDALFKSITEYDVRHGYRGPLFNLFDASRGIRGTAKLPTEKNGKNANANNGLIMDARNAVIKNFEDTGRKIPDYLEVMALADPSVVIENTEFPDLESLKDLLHKEDRYKSIHPALVLSVNDADRTAEILTVEGARINLTWEGMQHARAFRTDRWQSDAPKYPSEFLLRGDLIFTYMQNVDPNAGKWVPESKRKPNYDLLTLTQLPDVEGAFIALDPHNGAIRAMAGGFDFEKSKFNRTTQLLRQTGSNFKPFIYSAAVAYGVALNSVFPDEPIKTWDAGSQRWWQPRNSPNKFEGLMTVRTGLAKSKNSISIRLIRQIGVKNVVEHLRKFDIMVPKFQQSEAMALGSMELTPLQVATAYATFANGGYKLSPYLIERIELESGEVLYQANPPVAFHDLPDIVENSIPLVYKEGVNHNAVAAAAAGLLGPEEVEGKGPVSIAPQIVTHAHAYLVSSLMRSVIYGSKTLDGEPFYGTGARLVGMTGRKDLYGKTGTTNNVHDAWFSGFNADIVCTAWVGFDNDRDLGYARTRGSESGSASALPIFGRFIKTAIGDSEEAPIPMPKGITWITNRGITEPALPGMRVFDNASSASGMKNTGIDSSSVSGEGDIF